MRKTILIPLLIMVILSMTTYAQWNNPYENNDTQGFMYLTNLSFVDTFEFYDYNPIWSFQGNEYAMDYEAETAADVRQGNTGTMTGYTFHHVDTTSAKLSYNATGGKYGGAYTIEGTAQSADFDTGNFINATQDWTYMWWMYRLDNMTTNYVKAAFIDSGYNFIRAHYREQYCHDNGIRWRWLYIPPSSDAWCVTGFHKEEWHHAAVSKNSTDICFYIDATLSGCKQTVANFNDNPGTLYDFSIYDTANASFDDIRISQAYYTNAELEDEMNSANPVHHVDKLIYSMSAESWGKNSTHAYDTNPTVQGHNTDNTTQAMRFDGVDDTVVLPTIPDITDTDIFTISGWFNEEDGSDGAIFYQEIGNDRLSINYHSSGNLRAGFYDGGAFIGSASGNVLSNVWNNFVYVYHGNTTGQLYINNILQTGTNDISVGGTDGTWFGARNGAANFFFGSIDDVMIWDRALSQAEITALYTGTARPEHNLYPADLTQPARWILVNSAPTTAKDSTTLNLTDNGYGFQTNTIRTNASGTLGSYLVINPTITNDYNNYESIFRMKKTTLDLGADICRLWITASDIVVIRQADLLRFQINSIFIDTPKTLTDDTWTWFRYTKNDTWCSWYYDTIDGNNWVLGYNATCSGDNITGRLTASSTECYLDNFILRELMPNNVQAGATVQANFIYDSSNETAWVNATYDLYHEIYGVKTILFTEDKQNPTDFNQSVTTTLTLSGTYWWNITVCDAVTCAWNVSQQVKVLMGGLNVTIRDAGNDNIITWTPVTVTIDRNNFTTQNNITAAGFIFYPELGSGIWTVAGQATDYPSRDYLITVNNNAITQFTMYLLNSTNIVTFSVKDFDTAQFIEGALVTVTKKIGGNFITVGQDVTDVIGSSQFALENDITYRIIFQEQSYFTRSINLEPIETEYTILLTKNITIVYRLLFDEISYTYSPTTGLIAPLDNYNFTFTVVSPNGVLNWFSISTDFNGSTTTNVTGSPNGGTAILQRNLSAHPSESFSMMFCFDTTEFERYCFNASYIVNPVTIGDMSLPSLINDSANIVNLFSNENRGTLILSVMGWIIIAFFVTIISISGLGGRTAAGVGMLGVLGMSLLGLQVGVELFPLLWAIIINFVYFTGLLIFRPGEGA